MNYWQFVAMAEKLEGVDDLCLRVGHDRIFEALSLPVVRGTHKAPTLLAGIDEFARRVRGEYSGMRVGLARGEGETVRFYLKKTFDTEVPGYTQTEWYGIVSLIGVVQLFAGRSWQPVEISLCSPRVLPPLAAALYPDVAFKGGQEKAYVSFPKTLLSVGPCAYGAEVVSELRSKATHADSLLPAADFADSLQRLVASYLPDGYPSLEQMAEVCGLAPRTLQRRLADDDLEYSWLVEKTRFEVASRLLLETDASSLDVAFATGYEDPSHFARAFKRIADCSPREFRRRHSAQK